MLARIVLLLTLLPLVELALLLWIAQHTSWQTALLLVILPSLLGAYLMRRAGARSWQGLRRRDGLGQVSAHQLADGAFTFLAGVLLLAPGILTDLAGLALLLPPVQRFVKYWLVHRITGRVTGWSQSAPPTRDRIIDVQVIQRPARPLDDSQEQ